MLRCIRLGSRLAAAPRALPSLHRSLAQRAAAPLTLLHTQSLSRLPTTAAASAFTRLLSTAVPQPQPLTSSGGSESFAFQAETKQLLDIVARSLCAPPAPDFNTAFVF